MEPNPYSPPVAVVSDVNRQTGENKTPWGRAAEFYWAFFWRTALISIGMFIPFFVITIFIKFMLDAWPLLERLVILLGILAVSGFASCLAISWAAQKKFQGYVLRILDSQSPSASSGPVQPDVIPLTRAGRLFAAHLWRYILVVTPVNVALMWLLVGLAALSSPDGMTVLKVQAINLSIGFIVGIWAMREALGVAYRGFHFHWVAAEPESAKSATRI